MLPTSPTHTYLEALLQSELDHHAAIVRARAYHSGRQPVALNPRLQTFLTTGIALNLSRAVITAITERLHLTALTAADPAAHTTLADLWHTADLALTAARIHEWALRDGEAFLLIDWDTAHQRPRFTPHPRYTDTAAGGDGYGIFTLPTDDAPDGPPTAFVKQWTERVSGLSKLAYRQRRTLYYPDRIERYAHTASGWQPLGPHTPWKTATGQPLGHAAIHFTNPDLRPEATDALPIQDALNKTLADLLATADLSAFQILVALGWLPTSDGREPRPDGSNWLKLEPGQIIGTTRPKTDADLKAITPGSLDPLLNLAQQLVLWLALVSDTPVHRFITTRQIASEATLRQQEEPLLAKIRARQMRLTPAWITAARLALRLHNRYGVRRAPIDDTTAITPRWAPLEARRDQTTLAEWRLKADLGLPRDLLLREMGYEQPVS